MEQNEPPSICDVMHIFFTLVILGTEGGFNISLSSLLYKAYIAYRHLYSFVPPIAFILPKPHLLIEYDEIRYGSSY